MTTSTDTLAMIVATMDKAANERGYIVANRATQSARDFLERSAQWEGTEYQDAWDAFKTLHKLITVAAERGARLTLRNKIEQAARNALRETERG
jgi:hypothetical protein